MNTADPTGSRAKKSTSGAFTGTHFERNARPGLLQGPISNETPGLLFLKLQLHARRQNCLAPRSARVDGTRRVTVTKQHPGARARCGRPRSATTRNHHFPPARAPSSPGLAPPTKALGHGTAQRAAGGYVTYAHRLGGALPVRPLSPRPCRAAVPEGPVFCFFSSSKKTCFSQENA